MSKHFAGEKAMRHVKEKSDFFLSLMFWWTNFYIVMLEHSGLYSYQKCKQKFVYITKMAIQKGSHMKGSRPPDPDQCYPDTLTYLCKVIAATA